MSYKLRTRNDYFYFSVATINYLELRSTFDSLEKVSKEYTSKAEQSELFIQYIFNLQKHASICTIYSALCLEAFINEYGIMNFSKSYVKKYLDNLSPISKWVVIPRLVTGKEIEKNGQAFQDLKKLFNKRNDVVHAKSNELNPSNITYAMKQATNNITESKNHYYTIQSVLKELYKLDPKFKLLKSYLPYITDVEFEKRSVEELFYDTFYNIIPNINEEE